MELEIVYLSPDELTPYENNTRKHAPQDIDQIKASIEADGFNDPIGIWGENNLIVEGHGRQIAALEMGLDKVPCIRLDHLTETQRKDYAIRHNRTAELSEWDTSKLEEEVARLEIEGVDLSGLNLDELIADQGDDTENYLGKYEASKDSAGALMARYNVLPFSVLDTRQGYWQEKKDAWLQITGDLSETRDGEFGKFSGNGSN